MDRKALIKKYIEYFKNKNHKLIPNSSLVPKEDPTVLFTTAGMHPLVPFLNGQKHPQGKRLVGLQKCIRTGDIDLVGDRSHHTFFEMLGNWSLGDYDKAEAIEMSLEFLTKVLKIKKDDLSVTCFKGDIDAPKDTVASNAWKKLGIKKIKFLGKDDNWWGPAGKTGPCGPDTEMFVNDFEIWNDVFMQYYKDEKGNYKSAKQKNIDTGMGVERTLTILNNLEDNYLTEVWLPIIKRIEKACKKNYSENKKAMRIIADHIKASVFILAEGITSSNKEQGYVLRRLIRRALRYSKEIKIRSSLSELVPIIINIYKDYTELQKQKSFIIDEIKKEEEKFLMTLEKGLNRFHKLTSKSKKLSGKDSFLLYQSFGFPIEMIIEETKKHKIKFNKKDFELAQKQHQELSQTASVGKYKSGLADHSKKTTQLHTATHILLEALRRVLKDNSIIQRGSNITPERLRLDFSFPRKLEPKEIKAIEELVNKVIKQSLPVKKTEMSLKDALKSGAASTFGEKYPDRVSVYEISGFSKELCTGPHIANTKELGRFSITKETSSSAGVRRIKATLS